MEMPPIEWLFDCSNTTLQDLELAALNRAQRHMKALKADTEAAVNQLATAELARYMREHREEMIEIARRTIEGQAVIPFPVRKRA
jgi:hypothetical protein